MQDDDGRLWVGTEGQGIVVLENGKEVQRFTEAEGLLSNTIEALGRDQFGHVWSVRTRASTSGVRRRAVSWPSPNAPVSRASR
ncbi:MAG: hypothetical protein H6592_07955 [Flavobacteriales bacterium]|nr:hypothetical protein [Flavobacteriales bacterium]